MPQATATTSYQEIWDSLEKGPAILLCSVDLTTARELAPVAGAFEVIPANKPMLVKSNGKTYGKVASGTAVVQIFPI
jgi:hypothetical protein